MENFHLDDLPALYEAALDDDFCRMMVKSCIVTLHGIEHQPGVNLSPTVSEKNLFKADVTITWNTPLTKQMAITFVDENRATDFAAMCVALFLTLKLTPYRFAFPSQAGSGIDFWLSTTDRLTFEARLEISGIKRQTITNSIERRVNEKMKQTEKSDNTQKTAYIAVVEFSKPESIFIEK